ncbi:MAG: hypothetical protein KDA91_23730 [Planctomycetaceae bacterium]|nr:hypothetical protein [Planctomycetaceae bacterium]
MDSSSAALRRWEDDGGPAMSSQAPSQFQPADHHPQPAHRRFSRSPDNQPTNDAASSGSSKSSHGLVDLIVLPFTDYTSRHPERLDALRSRLARYTTDNTPQFVVVDTTRIQQAGAVLAGILHSTSRTLKTRFRRLVLVGDVGGVLNVTRLSEVCPLFENREAAFRWCHNNARM